MLNYIFVYGNQNIPYSRGTFKLINTIILYYSANYLFFYEKQEVEGCLQYICSLF